MLNNIKKNPSLLAGAGVAVLLLMGTAALTPSLLNWLETRNQTRIEELFAEQAIKPSQVLPLVLLAPEQRDAKLKAIADSPTLSLDRSRARYLLATDLLEKYEGGPALRQLENLEKEYPLLAPYVLLKQGRGYELSNEPTKARETWQKILEDYPDSPVRVEALYKLGQKDSEYWDQALKDFPSHPRSHQIARERLEKNPDQVNLLKLLAKYEKNNAKTNEVRAVLGKDYANELSPEDWQAIADGYWDVTLYKKAAESYGKAPATPQNRYRWARSLQVSDQPKAAFKIYQQMVKDYPNDPETATALKRLAGLSLDPKIVPKGTAQAIAYLDQIMQNFPEQAPDALLEKADLLAKKGDRTRANQLRKTLLEKYPQSDASAEYRWKTAKIFVDAGNLVKAWEWAQPITVQNPDSPIAPKAAFWVGKWALQLGKQKEAENAFRHVLGTYPESYYAWRSAVMLNWDVGDFNSVKEFTPNVSLPTERPHPAGGSETFRELYRLGEDGDAITLFNAEIGGKNDLTVDEQFTLGLLRLLEGRNLEGMGLVWQLKQKEEPENQEQWQKLRQTSDYWHALFPFPYADPIFRWSKQRKLNPLLVTSLIRQESRFEPEIRSPVGALGLMQVMPATGEWVAAQIGLKNYSLTKVDDNVNLGTWYLDHTHQEYLNNSMLAVASYNAGPAKVTEWMQRFNERDPDVFVEKIPYKETKGYVESVFSNYWNYLRIYNPEIAQQLAKE